MKLKIKTVAVGAVLALTAFGTLTIPTAPAEAGARTGTWRYYGPHGYHRRPNLGGALAAGAIGGVALGALAASARPTYAHPAYGYPDSAPVTYQKRVVVKEVVEDDDEEECRVIVKRRYNDFGELVVKRIRICD